MRKRQEGSAMIVVICIMVMTTALCLALLLTASVSIQNANRSNNKEQCRINAVSVSNVLIEEIKAFRYGDTLSAETSDYDTMPDKNETEIDPAGYKRPIEPDKELRDKLQTVNRSTWYAYNSDLGSLESWATSGKREYVYYLQGEETLPGKTVVSLYWVNENEEGKECPDEFDPEGAAIWFEGIKLYVKVTSAVGEESSTVISSFSPSVETVSIPTPEGVERKKWKSWSWSYHGHEWERGES